MKNMIIIAVAFSLLAISCNAAYTLVPTADYNKLPLLASTRDFGVQKVISQSISEGKLANTTYEISANNSIYNNTDGANVYFKFDLTLKNKAGDSITTNFVVQYNTQTKTNLLQSQTSSIAYKNADATTTTPTTTTTTPTTTTTGTTGTTGTTTTTPATGTSSAYAIVPKAEYTSAVIQSLLTYGVNTISAKAVADGKVPAGTYTSSGINSLTRQVLSTGTNYKFDVNIQNKDKSRTINGVFTINYVPKSAAKSITSYSYNVLTYAT